MCNRPGDGQHVGVRGDAGTEDACLGEYVEMECTGSTGSNVLDAGDFNPLCVYRHSAVGWSGRYIFGGRMFTFSFDFLASQVARADRCGILLSRLVQRLDGPV